MRFAFAGIDFLGDVFHTLIDQGWEPVKLFTRHCDKIYDFNEETIARARVLKIPVQMTRIHPDDLAKLKLLGCDALIVAGYPWLIKDWDSYLTFGCNFHPSPLPLGRGPYPLFQAILEGVSDWGVTAHVLAPTFDTGAILAQERFPLALEETHDTLLAKCQMAAGRLALTLAHDFARFWKEAQPQGEGTYWPRITQTQRTLDFTQDVGDVLRQVRAFGSIETLGFVGGKQLHVWQASGWSEPHGYKPGTEVHRHRHHILIAARDGFVQITGWSAQALDNAKEARR